MRGLRQRTIGPVSGSLLQHYGLRRVNTQGRSSAHKIMLLNAMAFNLKKLLKHQLKQALRQAIALPTPLLSCKDSLGPTGSGANASAHRLDEVVRLRRTV
jgi:hypothetical protein